MAMTEKMRMLKRLHEEGECTLLRLADATDIPAARVLAALGSLVRGQDVVQARRDGFARFTITEAGRAKAESWDGSPRTRRRQEEHRGH